RIDGTAFTSDAPTSATRSAGADTGSMVKALARLAVCASGVATTTFQDPVTAPSRSKVAVRLSPSAATATAVPTMLGWPERVSLTVAPEGSPSPKTVAVTGPVFPPLDGVMAVSAGKAAIPAR